VSVRIVGASDVARLLPMGEAIAVMEEVFRTLARGDAVQPLRSMLWMPDRRGLLGLMPAHLGSPSLLGLKVVSVMPGNHGTEFDSHQGAVLVFETTHGSLRAVIDATSITAIRTAAVTQARTHLRALRVVRKLRRIRVWSPNPARAAAFAREEPAGPGPPIEVMASAREAVAGADLICTVTSSKEPVLEGAWIAEGAHINAVGACFANARELDTAAVKRSRLIVDRRESTLAESGDFLIPRAEGAIDDRHILGELGDVLTGAVRGRERDTDVTLFKSLGLAVEDLAAAHHVAERAEASNQGISIELGGRRASLE